MNAAEKFSLEIAGLLIRYYLQRISEKVKAGIAKRGKLAYKQPQKI